MAKFFRSWKFSAFCPLLNFLFLCGFYLTVSAPVHANNYGHSNQDFTVGHTGQELTHGNNPGTNPNTNLYRTILPEFNEAQSGNSPPICDPGNVIDVMVLYSSWAEVFGGGAAFIEGLIVNAITQANQAFANSGTNLTLNPVFIDGIGYFEDTNNYNDHAFRLQQNGDGFMDSAHTNRNQSNADLVNLIVWDQSACEASFILPDQDTAWEDTAAFSVITLNCLIDNPLLLAHAFGHNLGSAHLPEDGGPEPIFNIGYGHKFNGDSGTFYRTIMSLAPGEVIPHFSNPNVLFDGQPTGVAASWYDLGATGADNVQFFSRTSPFVASFRCEDPTPIGDTTGDNYIDVRDLLEILANWGPCDNCTTDVTQDGFTHLGDIDLIFHNWNLSTDPNDYNLNL